MRKQQSHRLKHSIRQRIPRVSSNLVVIREKAFRLKTSDHYKRHAEIYDRLSDAYNMYTGIGVEVLLQLAYLSDWHNSRFRLCLCGTTSTIIGCHCNRVDDWGMVIERYGHFRALITQQT